MSLGFFLLKACVFQKTVTLRKPPYGSSMR